MSPEICAHPAELRKETQHTLFRIQDLGFWFVFGGLRSGCGGLSFRAWAKGKDFRCAVLGVQGCNLNQMLGAGRFASA